MSLKEDLNHFGIFLSFEDVYLMLDLIFFFDDVVYAEIVSFRFFTS